MCRHRDQLHLRVLRQAGLVNVRRQAQKRVYELRPEPLTEIDSWLAPYRQLWSDRFDALERHLDAVPDLAAAKGAAETSGPAAPFAEFKREETTP